MSRLLSALLVISSSLIFLIYASPEVFHSKARSSLSNNPPVAVDDSYNVHGLTLVGPMMSNDYDPDPGDYISFGQIESFPSHGTISGTSYPDRKLYRPNYGYTGTDTFTYSIHDSFNATATATVTLTITNSAPVAVTDSYTVHGATVVGPFLANDYDPDGDPITMGDASHESIVTFPSHGTLTGVSQPDKKNYSPNLGYTGSDSFTYQICDDLGACSQGTVNLNVVNGAPVAVADHYTVRGATVVGPFMVNDYDPDGDPITMGGPSQESIVTFPAHGRLF